MPIEKQNQSRPRVLILGETERAGSKVIAELERINTVQVVYSSRNLAQVEAWRRDGKDAVLFDFGQPEPSRMHSPKSIVCSSSPGTPSPWCIRARRSWTLPPTRA
jgi:hypothetical protein